MARTKENGLNEHKSMKSKCWAYFFWLFGGLFGAHHVYLGRDIQAFVYIITFGGWGFGFLRDIYRIPAYVADANDDPAFLEDFKRTVRANRKPPFSATRFTAGTMIAYYIGELFKSAIPQDEVYGINFRYLLILIPAVIALGIWMVGNIGRQQGSIWIALVTAYLFYPTLYYIADDTIWIFLMAIASSLSFDTFSKQWRLKPKKRRSFIWRMIRLGLALMLFFAMIGSFFYFNAIIMDSEGEEIKLSEAVRHFFTSPIWIDLKTSTEAVWNEMKHQGFWATWTQIVDLTDPRGEINAYKVLGLSPIASQNEVTARWRALSRDNHPDKIKGSEEERHKAQEKFMEIQQAYEILSQAKNRRNRRNRRSEE